jgi:chromosome segregation ATPase
MQKPINPTTNKRERLDTINYIVEKFKDKPEQLEHLVNEIEKGINELIPMFEALEEKIETSYNKVKTAEVEGDEALSELLYCAEKNAGLEFMYDRFKGEHRRLEDGIIALALIKKQGKV